MKELLAVVTEPVVVIINAMALLMIVYGTLDAFLNGLRGMVNPSPTGGGLRNGYQRYARWLIAGLTFQLAADILGTAVTPSWDEIGRLAAIAVIRTFLNFFLERDLKEMAEPPSEKKQEAAPANGT
jgi:uncharacterized membrane protein